MGSTVDLENKKQYEWHAREKNVILFRLAYVEFTKVMRCTIAKEVWDKLQSIYEDCDKVRKDKLQMLSV